MEGKVNYTAVGVFLVCLSAILIAGIFWLSSLDHGKTYRAYIVYMHEDVTGLTDESPVQFNGVKVGYVESMRLDPRNSKLVKLVLRIEPGVSITTSTYAILRAQGVTGVVTVNLKSTTETAPLLEKTAGEDYPVIPAHPSLLTQVSAALPTVAADFQKLSNSVSQLLSEKNLALLQQSLANIAKTTDELPKTVDQFNQTLITVSNLSAKMTQASKTVDSTMKSGEQAIHIFSTQVLPTTQQTLVNLTNLTQNMNQLTEELQHNPSMLVRGKQPSPLGPGEK
ncbi:MAG: MlaD family protein [Coxiellaceae bacterium]|nr:MlaD family protein [Coxiellaceae bacterium]